MGNGVIHVGAHKGEEVPEYIAEGRRPIICFEPQYLAWDTDDAVFRRCHLYHCALSNETTRLTLRIPRHLHQATESDTMSATGLPIDRNAAIAIGWTPTPCGLIDVPVERFDHWASIVEFRRGSCTLLVIDVQGMELQVLQGFGDYLNDFSEMVIECSETPIYHGGASAQEVVDYLSPYGFVPTSPLVAHGDIRFSRK